MRILLVEDEVSLSNAIKTILEHNEYSVDAVYDGLSAIDYAKGSEYNLIILDVMLPKLDGLEVVRILRKDAVHTPVLMLTARSTISDKVLGLNSGADDYLTKPFDPQELVARVGALTRRTGEVILDHVRFGAHYGTRGEKSCSAVRVQPRQRDRRAGSAAYFRAFLSRRQGAQSAKRSRAGSADPAADRRADRRADGCAQQRAGRYGVYRSVRSGRNEGIASLVRYNMKEDFS